MAALPFDDTADFDDDERGFVAKLDPCIVRDESGRVPVNAMSDSGIVFCLLSRPANTNVYPLTRATAGSAAIRSREESASAGSSVKGAGCGPARPVRTCRVVRASPTKTASASGTCTATLPGECPGMPTITVGRPEGQWTAMNDISVHRRPGQRVADLAYGLAGEEIGRVRCDGLVVCTPQGSTGYNLANAGPVLAWGVRGYVVSFDWSGQVQ